MASDVDLEKASVSDLLHLVSGLSGFPCPEASLSELARASPAAIASAIAITPSARVRRASRTLAAAFELGRRAELARSAPRTSIATPADVAAWAAPRLADLTHEELWMLGLDGRGYLRGARCIARGGLHGAAVRPADALRAALRVDASAFVLVHNHPSGDPSPSAEDIVLTEHTSRAASAAGIPLLDHVVVARGGFATVPI